MGVLGVEQVATSAGSARWEEVNNETIFLGHLRLQPTEAIPPNHVLDAYEATTGHHCAQVVLVSGSSAAAALTALGAHPIDVTVDRVLDSVYGETLSGSFMDASERDAFTQTFLRLFTDIAANAVRHTFRDHKGWVGPNDFTGDKIYAAVYKAVVLAHYYYFGFGRKSEHAALTHRLRPLIALIDHVAIPFALADGKSTLLCLAD